MAEGFKLTARHKKNAQVYCAFFIGVMFLSYKMSIKTNMMMIMAPTER